MSDEQKAANKARMANHYIDQYRSRAESSLAAPSGSAHCVKYGCWRMPLKYMKAGESHETRNGRFSVCISGHYCPSCGAGYGGGR